MEAAMGLGAAGFIPKDASIEELRTAIEEVLAGRRYVSPRVPKQGHRGGSAVRMGFLRLTQRQQELVRMIGRGMTSAQMAQATGLSHGRSTSTGRTSAGSSGSKATRRCTDMPCSWRSAKRRRPPRLPSDAALQFKGASPHLEPLHLRSHLATLAVSDANEH